MKGKKETEGKLPLELDWGFIKQMAERMYANKKNGKYPPYNWQDTMEIQPLLDASMRHMFEILNNNFEDDGRAFGHIEAVATNMMMINYQLKTYHKNEK